MKKFIASNAIFLLLYNTLFASIPSTTLTSAADSTVCNKDIKVSFVASSKKTYPKNTREIEIVFDGVFVEYAFEQIGYVEVSGIDSTRLNDLIECLKSVAASNGADAVINIKRQDIKNRPAFNGILIKYVTDDQKEESSIQKEPSGFAQFLKVVAGAIVFSLLLFFELNYNDDEEETY